jgi:hypothetical protein
MQLHLTYKKSTKGTHVYEDVESENPEVPTIYIRKYALPDEPPAAITLTIDWEADYEE